VLRRSMSRRPVVAFVAAHFFLPSILSLLPMWSAAPVAAQEIRDDPWKWAPDKKVEMATERLKELKAAAEKFSAKSCPRTRGDFDGWLDEALEIIGSLIGLQDSTRQIRKTGAAATRLSAWDAAKGNGSAGSLGDLTDLLGRCVQRVKEADKTFRPPSQEDILQRAYQRISAKKKSELASFGIPLEEKDYFKAESPPSQSGR
jgi:hypothetical protein